VSDSIFHKHIFTNIRFWILLFALLRLYGITNPPLEPAHSWRQTTVAMVARNFYEVSPDIFYPRIDIAGDKTGITGMEFPLFNYLIYLVSLIFGFHEWYGRLINLIVSSTGIYYFYLLVKKYFSKEVAFNATFILLVSFWFSYARKIMPDTFASTLVIISMFYGSNYLDRKQSISNLLLYIFFGTIGILSKIPVAYIWVIWLFWFLNKDIKGSDKLIFVVATIIIAIPVYYWYFIWVPYLVSTYGFWHFFMGESLTKGVHEIMTYFPRVLNHFYETALKFIGFGLFLFGLVMATIKKEKIIWAILLISLAGFSVIILKAGRTFAFHSYYILPFVPVMALMAGYGLSQIRNRKAVYILLAAVAIEGLLNQWNDFYIKPNAVAMEHLENDLNRFSSKNDLIVINSGNNPAPMYFAHRKGWVAPNDKILDTTYLHKLRDKGARYVLILKKVYGTPITLPENIVIENENYTVYRINTH
jgi:4-amino-4-deoxy-L-arabinose transferase-like glycosyltransferase